MPRFQLIRIPEILVDLAIAPEQGCPSETERVVPDSFAEWLAQPCHTISAGPETEQGIFVGLLSECSVKVIADAAIRLQS